MNRYNDIKRASILGILGNLFLLIIKFIVGFISHSQAMISDAFNSAGDIVTSLMTFIGNKIANKPKDKEHNLGYGKAEYIFSMLISVSMIIVSIETLKSSFEVNKDVPEKYMLKRMVESLSNDFINLADVKYESISETRLRINATWKVVDFNFYKVED